MVNSSIPSVLRNPSEIREEQVPDVEEDDGAAEEETLSLSDLPVNTRGANQHNILQDDPFKSHIPSFSSSSSSGASDDQFFEFFSSFSSDMCPADDIILFGKLVPLNDKLLSSSTNHRKPPIKPDHRENLHSQRSDPSVSKVQTTVKRSKSDRTGTSIPTPQPVRHSRSLDYRKLSGSSGLSVSKSQENIDRDISSKSVGRKSDTALSKMACKPRWYLFMFGSVKVPAEVEINEMKKRLQLRPNQSIPLMFPMEGTDGRFPVEQSKSGDVSWTRVLKGLCCKDPNSVAVVTTSFTTSPSI